MPRSLRLSVAVALATLPGSRAHADVRVAVERSGLAAELDGRVLEARVVSRLAQEGYAVVSAPPADVEVRVSGDRSALAVDARSRGIVLHRELHFADEPLAEIHLEVSQKVVELVRSFDDIAHDDDAPSVPRPPPIAVARVASPAPAASAFALGLGFGLVRQADDLAPAWSVVARGGTRHRVRLVALGTFAPSSGEHIDVFDWELLGGVGVRLWRGARDELEASALAGVLFHRFEEIVAPGETTSGVERDVLIAGRLSYVRWLWPHLGIDVRAGAGAPRHTRSHELGGEVIWHDERLRLELATSLLYRW